MLTNLLRAYNPNAAKQVVADRLVYSETELKAVLDGIVLGQKVSTIRLGADIVLTSAIVLATAVYNVVIEGANKFGITGDILSFFEVGNNTVEGIALKGVNFVCGTSNLNTNLFHCTSGTASLKRVHVQGCFSDYLNALIAADTGTPSWADSFIENISFKAYRGAAFRTSAIGNAIYTRCSIVRCYSDIGGAYSSVSIANAATSGNNVYIDVLPTGTLANEIYLTTNAAEENVLPQPLVVGLYDTTLTGIDFTTLHARNGATHFTLQGSGTTSGAASLTICQFLPVPSKSYLVTARILGRRTNGTDPGQTNSYIISQQFKVSSTGAVTIGGVLSNVNTVDDASWAAAIDTSSGNIRIRSAGAAAINISWSATVEIEQI